MSRGPVFNTVSIDYDSERIQELIDIVEAVIENARFSREIAALFADPEEQAVLLGEMEAGIDLLKTSGKVRTETVETLLLGHLEWLNHNLPEFGGSPLIAAAADGLRTLLRDG